ncbi:hypothetical protein [Hymenobacter canadensis]|uniref:Peptidase M50 domain-containing protein n=1 Tax=Hymenobacter canadensis TaxID=2999067 RepID=A0ABY7LX50_9BACT|nr:hypothetical protein [Hymenobacter canadensis]WBA44169.1 hypothetical protein O3303_19985 [Hymenobacter canadensis]
MKTLRIIGSLLIGGLAGGLGARYGMHVAQGVPWSGGQKLALLLLPAVWLLAVLAHELGHVLLGQLNGFRFRWLAVGPFM